ncbi:hypothetical protein ZWY2020_031916 [Hordeum vulgare]|nr:hypothetical protein ZWY2020_031916 [Hordeum vulgare]
MSASLQPIDDVFSIVAGVVSTASAEATNVEPAEFTIVRITTSVPQDDNDGDMENNIDQARANMPIHERVIQLIIRVLGTMGLLTLVMDVRTMLYKPASGVIFGHNKLAYYTTLVAIFAIGVGEVFTFLWISWSGDTNRRCWIWGFVLFLSIWPFIGILSMGGFA